MNNDNNTKHYEISHIKKNMIEEFLYSIKFFIQERKILFKKISIIIGIFTIVITMGFILYNSASKRHNKLFIQYLLSYQNLQKEKKENTTQIQTNQTNTSKDKKELKALATKFTDLCNQFLSTKYSRHACLLAGEIYLQLNDYKNTSTYLFKYGDYFKNKFLGPYILFYAAQSYENILNLDKAYKIYSLLEKSYPQKNDLFLFHQAKILYYQEKLVNAKSKFQALLTNTPNTEYKEQAKEYLLLIDLALTSNKSNTKLIKNKTKKKSIN